MQAPLHQAQHVENASDELNIQQVVEALRDVRLHALQDRNRTNKPPKLPSRKALQNIVEGLGAALYPNRLGLPDIKQEGIDFFVGHTLDVALRELIQQATLELIFTSENQLVSHKMDNFVATSSASQFSNRLQDKAALTKAAATRINTFATKLPEIRRLLDSDIQAAFDGDPAAQSVDEILVCYPGIVAMIHHRIAHSLHQLALPLIARMIAEIAHSATGIDIHPGATIGESFFIDHGTGVVIGETCIIGNNVRVYQAVTLGAKRFPTDAEGHLLKGHARHPIIENHVVIYAGATVLGRITIGAGASIGGNVWLTHSVAPNSNITQAQTQQKPALGQ